MVDISEAIVVILLKNNTLVFTVQKEIRIKHVAHEVIFAPDDYINYRSFFKHTISNNTVKMYMSEYNVCTNFTRILI